MTKRKAKSKWPFTTMQIGDSATYSAAKKAHIIALLKAVESRKGWGFAVDEFGGEIAVQRTI